MSFLSALRNAKNKVLQAVAPSKPGQAVNNFDVAKQFFRPSTVQATLGTDRAVGAINKFTDRSKQGEGVSSGDILRQFIRPSTVYNSAKDVGRAVKQNPLEATKATAKGLYSGFAEPLLELPLNLTPNAFIPEKGKEQIRNVLRKPGAYNAPNETYGAINKGVGIGGQAGTYLAGEAAIGDVAKSIPVLEKLLAAKGITGKASNYILRRASDVITGDQLTPKEQYIGGSRAKNALANLGLGAGFEGATSLVGAAGKGLNSAVKETKANLKATGATAESGFIGSKGRVQPFEPKNIRLTNGEKPNLVPLEGIKSLEDTDPVRVAEYKHMIENGKPIDPIKLATSKDGTVAVQDGKHRLQALRELGFKEIPVERGALNVPSGSKPGLPPHLQSIVDKQKGVQTTIEDVTPKGMAPEKTGLTSSPVLEKLKGETADQAMARKVNYQVENGRVSDIRQNPTTHQWEAKVHDNANGKPSILMATKKEDLIASVYDRLNPRTSESGFFDISAFMPKKLREKLGLSQPELQQVARQGESSTGTLESLAKDSLPQEARAAEQAAPTAGGGLLDRIQQAAGTSTAGKSSLTDIALNTNKFNVSPEAKATIKANVEQIRPELESIVGRKLSNEETKNAAVGAEMLSKTVSRDSTKEFTARLTKLRQTIAAGSEGKGVSSDFIENLKTLKSIAADQGRKLQAFAIGADPEFKSVKEDIVKKILGVSDKTDEIIKAAEGVDFSNPKQVTELYRKFIKPGIGEVIDEYRYINLLSSPKTHLTNIFSNMLQVGLNPVTKLASGTLDSVASMLTGKARQHYVSEVPQYVRGLMSSIPTATADAFDVLTGKKFGGRPDLNMLGTNVPILRSGQIIPRALEASDIFFQSMIKDGEKAAISHRYKVLGKSLTPEMLDKMATEKAKYWVFHGAVDSANASGQGHLLSSIDKMTDAVYTLRKVPGVKWFIPFVQTPMNILKQMVEFSPAGLATLPGAKDKTEQLAKTLVGSMVFAGAGSIVMNNDVTWDVPTDKTGKEDFFAAGRKPYSIKINGNWVDYTKLGPLSFPIAMAAAIKNESVKPENQSKDTQEKIMLVTKDLAKFFTDQSYLTGMSDLIRTLQGDDQSLKRTITNMPRQLVPLSSLQGWVARIIDPVYRKSNSTLDSIKATIPFLSKTVEAYTDSSGQESKRPLPIFNSLSPVQVAPVDQKAEGQYKEIQQLRQATSEQKQATSLNQSKATAIIHELKDLQPEQRKAALAELVQSGHLTPEVLSEVKSQITKSAKPQPTSNLDKRLASAPIAARAQIVISEIKGLSPEDRKARLAELVSEGIVTKETLQQMAQQARK